MKSLAFLTILGLAFFVPPGAAQGGIIFFDNRVDFDAATSGRTIIDFEGIAPDGGALSVPTPPGITLSGVNFTTSDGILVVWGRDFLFPGNSILVCGQTMNDPDIIATLPGSFVAFGMDFAAGPSTVVTFTLSTGDTFTRTGVSDLTFVGLLSTDPFTSVTMSIPSPVQEAGVFLYIDNFTFGNGPTAVPEPSSWFLAAIGAGTMFGLSWRPARLRRGAGRGKDGQGDTAR